MCKKKVYYHSITMHRRGYIIVELYSGTQSGLVKNGHDRLGDVKRSS